MFSLSSPFASENLVSRDGFGSRVPRQPAHLDTQTESDAYILWGSSRVMVTYIARVYSRVMVTRIARVRINRVRLPILLVVS